MNEIKYINNRGVVMLHSGYQYHKKRSFKNGSVIWRCSKWRKFKCNGTLNLKVSHITH